MTSGPSGPSGPSDGRIGNEQQTGLLKDSIRMVVEGHDLTQRQARDVMSAIMDGHGTPAQIAGLLVALRMKGETVDEITGFCETMRAKCERISVSDTHALDTCGTGGDTSGTFNISTAVAIVAAGAGVTVAKHGNRSVSSRSGSADVLEALGVRVDLSPEQVRSCIESVGIGFMFAPAFHKAMKHVAMPRKELGIRTVFNVLGPLVNPAFCSRQLLGVFSPDLTGKLAQVLAKLGTTHAYVVHGDGLDEVAIHGETIVSEVRGRTVTTSTVAPETFGMRRASLDDIKGGDPDHNAAIIRRILDGEVGPKTDIVLLNAGFAIAAAGKAGSIQDGITLARESIASGKAKDTLERLSDFAQKVMSDD
ncbi:MAG: anthranilate phosphoribosyltransferase [archaeon]